MDLKTDRNEPFILAKDMEGKFAIFGCKSNLKCLSQWDTSYMDGTDKYCTKLYFEFFTIDGLLNVHCIRLVFCLLPKRLCKTYTTMFSKSLVLSNTLKISLNPQTIIIDFEIAIHNTAEPW